MSDSLPHFSSTSQAPFWKHLKNGCGIPIVSKDEFINRKDILASLESDVLKGKYFPESPIGFLSDSKKNSVPRFIPVFSVKDYSVFFASTKAFDKTLAEEAVEGTYGGWSLGGERRKKEEVVAQSLFEDKGLIELIPYNEYTVDAVDYMPDSTYTKSKWFENWQEYWKLLYATFGTKEYPFILQADIGNFYDNVDLVKLKKMIKRRCPKQELAADVLFHFLGHWNNSYNLYNKSVKGLPQDMVGDCSRILANYYLTSFDEAMQEHCDKDGIKYMRWADDLVFGCSSRKQMEDVTFQAQKRLQEIGLNLNSAKVEMVEIDEFLSNWRFEILMAGDEGKIDKAFDLLKKNWDVKHFARRKTCYRMLLNKLSREIGMQPEKDWIFSKIIDKSQDIIGMSQAQFGAILRTQDDLHDVLKHVIIPVADSNFTVPKTNLLKAIYRYEGEETSLIGIGKALLETKMKNDPLLKYAIIN